MEELLKHGGSNPSKQIYVVVKGRIFNVTPGKLFYGPGDSYCMFAEKDACRALAKMSKCDDDISTSLDGLSDKEIGALDDLEEKFDAKYTDIGRVASS